MDEKGGDVTTEAESGVLWPQSRDADSPWKPEEAEADSPLEFPEGAELLLCLILAFKVEVKRINFCLF